jgi:hypothetical protein
MKQSQAVILIALVAGLMVYQGLSSSSSSSSVGKHSFGETLLIDSQGRISLNGKQGVAIGFHLKHGAGTPSVSAANSMLQRLSSDGVRFMTLNFEGSMTDQQVKDDIAFWMPKLASHRMWTFIQVQHLKIMADGSSGEPPTLDVAVQLPRQQLVINELSKNVTWSNMVYAWTIAWELDNWYNDAQVTAYLQVMTPQVKTLLHNSVIGDVPILNKPCSADNNNRGKVVMGAYADLVGLDKYGAVTVAGSGVLTSSYKTQIDLLFSSYLSLVGKSGYQIWHTEWGIQGNGENTEITSSIFQQVRGEMGHGNCGSIMIWLMWSGGASNYTAFNTDGTAKAWYSNIASQLTWA